MDFQQQVREALMRVRLANSPFTGPVLAQQAIASKRQKVLEAPPPQLDLPQSAHPESMAAADGGRGNEAVNGSTPAGGKSALDGHSSPTASSMGDTPPPPGIPILSQACSPFDANAKTPTTTTRAPSSAWLRLGLGTDPTSPSNRPTTAPTEANCGSEHGCGDSSGLGPVSLEEKMATFDLLHSKLVERVAAVPKAPSNAQFIEVVHQPTQRPFVVLVVSGTRAGEQVVIDDRTEILVDYGDPYWVGIFKAMMGKAFEALTGAPLNLQS